MDINKDYYFILGVHPTAEFIVIKASYRALTMLYHPDRYDGDKEEAHQKTIELNEAYSILKDESKRKEYDNLRGNNSHSADEFIDDGFDEAPPKSDPLEKKWHFAVEYYPDLLELEQNLRKIAWRLANTYRAYIIEEKAFDKRQQIAEELEKAFLENYFGSNKEILEFAKTLILNKLKEAVRELNKAVVFFNTTKKPDKIIQTIIKKYELGNIYYFVNELNEKLIESVKENNFKKVEFYLSEGANPNVKTSSGISIMRWAFIENNKGIVKLLEQHGAY